MATQIINILTHLFSPQNIVTNKFGNLVKSYGNRGASEDEIRDLERVSSNNIPFDYIRLLTIYNGFVLFNFDDLAGFRFFSSVILPEENSFVKSIYDEGWAKDVSFFCQEYGSGNYLGFKTNGSKYQIIDCCQSDPPEYWQVISHSLYDFLEKLINSRGEPFWLSENEGN